MADTRKLDHLHGEVQTSLAFFRQRSHFNRRAALAFTLVPAALAAMATVAIGSSEKLGAGNILVATILPIFAMICTAIASILGAWEALYSNRKLWGVSVLAYAKLEEMKRDLSYRTCGAAAMTEVEIDACFDRLKAILAEAEAGYQKSVSMG